MTATIKNVDPQMAAWHVLIPVQLNNYSLVNEGDSMANLS